ncbi:hypothetical protein V8F33_011627 [Rhypophila sp. PSN 637]
MTTTTRSSAKKEDKDAAPPASGAEPGSKHKPDPEEAKDEVESNKHVNKKAKSSGEKTQKTLEETINGKDKGPKEEPKGPKDAEETKPTTGESAVDPHGRDADLDSESSVPSSILEKGIIYFFFRGRVNTQEPSEVNEIARSYILLRPIEKDAKLTSGPIGDAKNSRLCVIPKKVLPQSGRDRWISFVEKSGVSFEELKNEFLSKSEYMTKTVGHRTTPAATPIGEGVYAITSTGRESHLVYMLTLPEKLGEVQKEIGLKEKASFVISTKNPAYPGTANARLPEGADYPEEIKKEFHSRRWMPTQPHHLDYPNAQFLLVGESSGVEKALEPQEEDKKQGNEEPAEEMEKLEEEDTQRMRGLSKDDSVSIFKDLEVNAKDYPKLQTTF